MFVSHSQCSTVVLAFNREMIFTLNILANVCLLLIFSRRPQPQLKKSQQPQRQVPLHVSLCVIQFAHLHAMLQETCVFFLRNLALRRDPQQNHQPLGQPQLKLHLQLQQNNLRKQVESSYGSRVFAETVQVGRYDS